MRGELARSEANIRAMFTEYKSSLSRGLRHMLDRYRYVHSARKVVGVGSVGTRAWIALFIGRDQGDPLFLQIKEAQRSVLEPYDGKSAYSAAGPPRRRGAADDAGGRRHPARLDEGRGAGRAERGTSTFASSGMRRAPPGST